MSERGRVRLSDFEGIPADPRSQNGDGEWNPLSARDFLELPEPEGVELLGPLVLRGGRTLVGGDSGHGKTTLAFAMTAAVLKGGELLGHTGAGVGPALIIDLEQGVRSIKRGIRASGLNDADAYVLNLPDGLALDQRPEELAQLENVLFDLRPKLVVLDPYYKAHRGDANEERGVTDLMRNLDRFRTDYSFALLMPAHVRKEQQTGEPRKLTLADIAGSGAISRGAEVVIAIERLAHGHARLRYLKDREGELPVGDAIELTFSKADGFEVVEKPPERTIEEQIMAVEDSEWMTTREWATEIGLRHLEVKRVLERLAATGQIGFAVGPPGRSWQARCYSTAGVPIFGNTEGTPGTVGRAVCSTITHPPFRGGDSGNSTLPTAPESGTHDDLFPDLKGRLRR